MEGHNNWYQRSSITPNMNIKRFNHQQISDLLDRGLCLFCEELKSYIEGENEKYIGDQETRLNKNNQNIEVLNENSFAITNLIDCDDGFSKTVIVGNYDGANICLWKSFVAYVGEHNWAGYLLAKLNTIQLRSNALRVFDEIPKSKHLLCKAITLKLFKDKKLDNSLGLMEEENNWSSRKIFIQSGEPYVVEFFDEKLNTSKDRRVNLMGASLKTAAGHRRWVHHYMEENGPSYDFVIGRAMACAEAFQDIWEAPRKDVWSQNTTILMAAQLDRNGKFPHKLNHLGKESIKLLKCTVFVFDPGGVK